MWQKCPICYGTGKIPNLNSSSAYSICTVCNGFKIINKLTGLPPVKTIEFSKIDPIELNNLKNP